MSNIFHCTVFFVKVLSRKLDCFLICLNNTKKKNSWKIENVFINFFIEIISCSLFFGIKKKLSLILPKPFGLWIEMNVFLVFFCAVKWCKVVEKNCFWSPNNAIQKQEQNFVFCEFHITKRNPFSKNKYFQTKKFVF